MDNWSTDKEFLDTFRAEAEEHLRNLNEGLMELENSPGSEDLIKRLFREAHTLKGSAGMMGFTSVRDLAHHIEDILSAVQKGQTQLTREVTDLLLESLDRIEELLPLSGASDSGAEVVSLIDKLDSVECKDSVGSGKAAPSLGFDPGSPEQSDPDPVAVKPDPQESVPGPVTPGSGPRPQKASDPTIRVHIERLDKLLNLMGEVMVNQLDTESQVDNLGDIQNRICELQTTFAGISREVDDLKKDIDPGRIAVLDQQLHQAGENAQSVLKQLDSTASSLKVNTANRRIALDELQDSTLHVRMLPIASIFGLYPRVVRDAAGSCGKKVRLIVEGENTELDKRILEQVSDPLIHIIRNSVDHGIELPSHRVQAGKPEEGTVRLSAAQRGDKVEITVEDDGAGIDPAKLRQSGIAQGVISPDDEITDEEALELIFRNGFTTASQVTSISGRGVGLDVVRTNIEKLEGSVRIDSVPGEGTRLTVSLPATLAIFAGLLIACNQAMFVIPLSSVQEMVSIKRGDIQTLGNQRVFILRGNATPLIDLLDFLGNEVTEAKSGNVNAVVVGDGRNQIALEVGSFLGEQEVVIKSLGTFLPRLPNIAGITILADGEAVVVLNVIELITSIRSGSKRSSPNPRTTAGFDDLPVRIARVLIVEDSLVVRELQRNILESAGYKVVTAVDGEDALSQLSRNEIDCIVTDIEMPRMNGFDLVTAVRKNEATSDTPVIIVSSLNNEDDKKRGMGVGADAYVIKGTFDQQNLLTTIERLVA